MDVDEHLQSIRKKYNTVAAKLRQSEKLKDAAEINQIGNVIRTSRKSQGLTRKKLCDLSGVSYSTLNKIETGSLSVRLDIVTRVAGSLGLKLWIG